MTAHICNLHIKELPRVQSMGCSSCLWTSPKQASEHPTCSHIPRYNDVEAVPSLCNQWAHTCCVDHCMHGFHEHKLMTIHDTISRVNDTWNDTSGQYMTRDTMIQVLWSVPRKRHFQMTNDDGDSENYDRVQKHTKYMIIGFHLPLDII